MTMMKMIFPLKKSSCCLPKSVYSQSSYVNLQCLAKFLKLKTNHFSHQRLVSLLYFLLSYNMEEEKNLQNHLVCLFSADDVSELFIQNSELYCAAYYLFEWVEKNKNIESYLFLSALFDILPTRSLCAIFHVFADNGFVFNYEPLLFKIAILLYDEDKNLIISIVEYFQSCFKERFGSIVFNLVNECPKPKHYNYVEKFL